MFFFFNDTATTEIYTLSLHDALPISSSTRLARSSAPTTSAPASSASAALGPWAKTATLTSLPSPLGRRSEEHTSELQSRQYLVCRLLLEKKEHTTRTPIRSWSTRQES